MAVLATAAAVLLVGYRAVREPSASALRVDPSAAQTTTPAPPPPPVPLHVPGVLGSLPADVPVAATRPAPSEVTSAPGRWEPLPSAPLAERDGHVLDWTGEELLVWGGGALGQPPPSAPLFGDGAAFDPATQTWRMLAAAPLEPRAMAGAVWTGAREVVWGGRAASGAALADGARYDPSSDRWEPMPRSPLRPRWRPALVWTGREVWVLGGRGPAGGLRDAAAYDPVADRWRRLPPLPAPLAVTRSSPAAAVDGAVHVLLDGPLDSPGERRRGRQGDPAWFTVRADAASGAWSLVDAERSRTRVAVDLAAANGTLVRLVDDFGPGGPSAVLEVGVQQGPSALPEVLALPGLGPDGGRLPAAFLVPADRRVFVQRGGRDLLLVDLAGGAVTRLEPRAGPQRFTPKVRWADDRLLLWGGRSEAGGLIALQWMPAAPPAEPRVSPR